MNIINEDFVKDMFIEAFSDVANDPYEKLNENLTNRYRYDFPVSYHYNSDGELDISDDPEISWSKIENINVMSLKFKVEQTDKGLLKISGEAEVEYNLTAMYSEYYSGGYDGNWDSGRENYEMTDGKDKDEATIHFEFSGDEYVGRDNGFFSEYDCDFYVV